jgi:hypothetical protein
MRARLLAIFPSDNACARARARGGIKIRRERWYY